MLSKTQLSAQTDIVRLCEPPTPEPSENLPDALCPARVADDELRVNNDWRVEAVGPRAAKTMHWPDQPLSDFEGRRLWELTPRLVGTPAEAKLREAMHARRPVTVEWSGNGRRTLEISGRPVSRSWQLEIREIKPDTPRALPRTPPPAPAAVPPPETALAPALSFNPFPAYVFSALGRFLLANEPAARFLGWSPADLIGRTFLDLALPAPIATTLHHALQRVLVTGEPDGVSVHHPQPDGTLVRYEHRFVPLHHAERTVLRVLATAQPILAPAPAAADTPEAEALRHHALTELATSFLRESTRRSPLPKLLRRMADAAGAEIHVLHTVAPDLRRLSFEASGGLDAEQLVSAASPAFGEGLAGITADEDWPVVLDDVENNPHPAAAEPRRWGARAAVCHPLRSGGQLLGTLTLATTSRDRFTRGELAFIRDAANLLAGALEIRRTLDHAERAQSAAAAALRTKDEFIAAVSHELRTPLNPALLLASHAAANPELTQAVRGDFEAIASSLRTGARLVDDLLDLTRYTHGKLSLESKPVQLHTVLMDALTTIHAEVEQKRLELSLELLPSSPTVHADPLRLQQVFWNLLKNAVKFTATGGVLSVRTRLAPAGHVRIEIMDTGVGLTADEIGRAFDSFAQGEHGRNGSSPFGGLGLGLSIAQKIVALHSGRIHASSEGRDRGACFVVELPVIAHAPPPESDRPVPAEPPPEPASSARTGLRILLVEDHRATREALLQLLVQRDHEVIGAGSVSEARYIALKKQFDLVISDIGLPDSSGYELMAGLRSDYELEGIALTGHGTDEDIARARASGFVAHIVKPITIQALEAALADAVSAKSPGR